MSDEKTFDLTLPKIDLPSAEEIGANFKTAYDDVISKVDKEIAETPVDISTKKGRQALISLSAKISKTKVALDNRGKELAEPQKLITKAIDDERKTMREALEKRRDDVRRPVTEWEEAEKERKEKSDAAFEFLYTWKSAEHNGVSVADMGSEDLSSFLASIEALLPADADIFGEDLEGYEDLVRKTSSDIRERLEKVKADEKDREELAKLRAEREQREAVEREAEAKRKEAERLAAQKEQLEKEAREKAEREAEEKIAEERRRSEEAERRAESARREQEEAAKRAEQEKAEAAARAKEEQERAVEEERKRAEQEALARKEEEDRRAADLAIRNKIHGEIVADMVAFADISEAQAKRIITAIDDGKVKRLSIQY